LSTTLTDTRLHAMQKWLTAQLPQQSNQILLLAGDASFRRYFRVVSGDQQFVIMDAPPELENCHPFVTIAKTFQDSVVRLPHVFAWDQQQGFLLLSDFGDQQLLPLLNDHSADALYQSALNTLIQLQQCDAVVDYVVPHFDDAQLWREFDIFFTWYLQKHLQKMMPTLDEKNLRETYQLLIASAHEQPVVFVHRDYHSRNIMLCADQSLGILDFQDAVWGPITYDAVSLLRDCYIAWDNSQVEKWVNYFYQQLLRENKIKNISFNTFLRWFDWMGLQRHLKCLGIFSRLFYRDNKAGYLKEIPRVLNYALSVCERYPELGTLKKIL